MEPPGQRPWIIAHRGASRVERENTIAAFQRARELGADAVELDVRRTADGDAVVHHDAHVPDVGLLIDKRMSTVRAAAAWIPTLEEALDACAHLWVNIEIKNSPVDRDWDPDDRLLTSIAATIAGRDVLVSSFNPQTVDRARTRLGVPTGYLVHPSVDPMTVIDAASLHTALHVHISALVPGRLPALVSATRAHDLHLIAWTVDEPEEIKRLADGGVSGIITNVPDVALAALA